MRKNKVRAADREVNMGVGATAFVQSTDSSLVVRMDK